LINNSKIIRKIKKKLRKTVRKQRTESVMPRMQVNDIGAHVLKQNRTHE